MLAVFTVGSGGRVELREARVPHPNVGQALVKVVAAAHNPTDCRFPTSVYS